MRPVSDTMVLEDTIPGEEIAFGIGDPRFVMRAQADLYSDITTAVIREYSTNAYDAHIMAGHSDPIEVTLPSALNPFFIVRDHGTGMDMDTFRTIYTQFGVSNKRESNELNGQLGFGSKSGVAYTTSFQVTSVRDGIKIHGIVQRKPDWDIVLKVVSTQRTDEPNGTEIKIPVHNVHEFQTKANKFYSFWLPGRVIVNGAEVKHNVGEKISDNLYRATAWNESYVVMGNVPYRVVNSRELFSKTGLNHFDFVAYVDSLDTDDGAAPVEFTPSREDLKYTPRTVATLTKMVESFDKSLTDMVESEIANAKTHAEAFEAWYKVSGLFAGGRYNDLSFRGDTFNNNFKVKGVLYRDSRYSRVYSDHINSYQVDKVSKTLVVTECSVKTSTAVRSKAKEYAKLKGLDVSALLFTESSNSDIVSPWITRDTFVTWEDLKKALPKKQRTQSVSVSGRPTGSWDYWTENGFFEGKHIPEDVDTLLWVSHQSQYFSVPLALKYLGLENVVVLKVPMNRLEKLQREHKPTPLSDFIEAQVVVNAYTLLSEDERLAYDVERLGVRNTMAELGSYDIDDPRFDTIAKALKSTGTNEKFIRNRNLSGLVRLPIVTSEPNGLVNDVFKDYPLITAGRPQELVYYINGKYAARNGE